MNRSPVSSSSLAEVGYDATTQTLEIEFQGGVVYQYFDVPEAVVQGLLAAPSLGRYFNEQIRGMYPYARA